MKYVVVTPVRNEAKFVHLTLESVINQVVTPAQWVIVDDGSSDNTPDVVARYSDRYKWITLVRQPDRGFRMPGAGVVRAFNAGVHALAATDYDFIVKLDGDVSFAPEYFRSVYSHFSMDPRLGIAGGGCYVLRTGRWVLERASGDHVRGATKVYRRACYDDIGGLEEAGGWDAIDELRAQMKGWKIRSLPHLVVRHYRATGTAENKIARMVKSGEFCYYRGYHPLALLLRALYRGLTDMPPLLAGAGLLYGFLRSWMARRPQIDDPDLIRYCRQKTIRRLSVWHR